MLTGASRLANDKRYRLTLSMHPFDSLDWLPVLDEQGQVIGDIVILTLKPVVEEWKLCTSGLNRSARPGFIARAAQPGWKCLVRIAFAG